jgi:hypothetical protein
MSELGVVGPHRYRVTGDLLFWRPVGPVLPEHAEVVCDLLGQLANDYGYALWLVDAEQSVAIGHSTRMIYARRLGQGQRPVALASFHAKVAAKTTAALLTRGIDLLAPGVLYYQTFATEAEARTFLTQHRTSWSAAVAP